MTTIAIFGLNGTLAAPALEALQSPLFASKVKFPIIVVSRNVPESTSQIEYIKSDLSNTDELSSQLKGVDVFVELIPATKVLFDLLEKVAAIVKPKLYIPGQFGIDVPAVLTYLPNFLEYEPIHSDNLRALGIKTVDIVNGHFASPDLWLHEIVEQFGIDKEKKTYVVRGDINQKTSVTFLLDIGKTIAAVATNENLDKLPDYLRVFSENITVQLIIKRYEVEHGVSLEKTAQYTAEETLKELIANWTGVFVPERLAFDVHAVTSQGIDKGFYFEDNEREDINPGEKLWRWEKF